MGICLNPGNGMFQESLDSEIYIDKSGIIECTNKVLKTKEKYVCVSRPRRFGKSTTIDMLAAYYDRSCDSHEQFNGLAIANRESYETHMNKYDVIRVTMTSFLTDGGGTVEGAIALIEGIVKEELAAAYPESNASPSLPFSLYLERVYSFSKTAFVFLVDEWDCVMREFQDDDAKQKRYLDWLRSLLKDRVYVGLAYATGILPVKKYGQHSALNMFAEISVLDARDYAEYTGFTDSEVASLCDCYNMNLDEARRWYDGYNIDGIPTYNPRSIVMSMTGRRFRSYWTQTETFEGLRKFIVLDIDGLRGKVARLVAGESLSLNPLTFQNDMITFATADDVLTLLVHLGYLTYDASNRTVKIPNLEVEEQFASTLQMDGGWKTITDAISQSDELLKATLSCDAPLVARMVEQAHLDNASLLAYNDENALACVLSIAYYTAKRDYRIEREAPAGKGYADLIFWPRPSRNVPAIVVELKSGDTADDAISQIRSRDYMRVLSDYPEALLVGVSYDPDAKSETYKTHECKIERV